ncbi:hypothetical protein [Evansella clarkii]|uniref:hypothetical protein n=1 Tax=Evansella clarkii TaxID=79879 RepID=UPI001FD2A45C|nr:hypothetical protein [Evansella clarkii]
MSSRIKRKYRVPRAQFKKELVEACTGNPALATLIIETYTAWHHKRHICSIWGMFRNPAYANFQKDYSDNLMGRYLSGRIDIWRSLHFAGEKDLCEKYRSKIPERYALGDALSVAYWTMYNKPSVDEIEPVEIRDELTPLFIQHNGATLRACIGGSGNGKGLLFTISYDNGDEEDDCSLMTFTKQDAIRLRNLLNQAIGSDLFDKTQVKGM